MLTSIRSPEMVACVGSSCFDFCCLPTEMKPSSPCPSSTGASMDFPANRGRVVNSLMVTQVVNGSEALWAGVSLDCQTVNSQDRQHPLCSRAKGFAEAKPSSRCFCTYHSLTCLLCFACHMPVLIDISKCNFSRITKIEKNDLSVQ